MVPSNQLICFRRYLLTSFGYSYGLQKRFYNSTANGSEQANSQLRKSQDVNDELGGREGYSSDQSCVHMDGDWPEEHKAAVLQNMLVFRDFITEPEEESIMAEIGPYLKRMRYEFDHWDDAIHGFRETERLQWRPENEHVLHRVRLLALPPGTPPLRHVHVLDLAADGVIKPHVDSHRFCGSVIAGVSLLSDAVMRLVSCAEPARRLDALLPRRSLYVMRNAARYDYTHEILDRSESQFVGRPVPRDRRISIICRNEPIAAGADDSQVTAADDRQVTAADDRQAAGNDSQSSTTDSSGSTAVKDR